MREVLFFSSRWSYNSATIRSLQRSSSYVLFIFLLLFFDIELVSVSLSLHLYLSRCIFRWISRKLKTSYSIHTHTMSMHSNGFEWENNFKSERKVEVDGKRKMNWKRNRSSIRPKRKRAREVGVRNNFSKRYLRKTRLYTARTGPPLAFLFFSFWNFILFEFRVSYSIRSDTRRRTIISCTELLELTL